MSDSTDHQPSRSISVVPSASPWLKLLLQPGGVVVEVHRAELVVGRHSEAGLRLPLPDVSREHCVFRFESGQWEVQDLGSMNGTFVNEVAIERITLRHGDRVTIGGFDFQVDLDRTQSVDPPDAGLIRKIFKEHPRNVA